MNITQIIQKKFPKFTKEKYSDLFEEIIRAALNPVSDQKVESITCDILSVKSKKKKKQSFWFDILTSSFRSDLKFSLIIIFHKFYKNSFTFRFFHVLYFIQQFFS